MRTRSGKRFLEDDSSQDFLKKIKHDHHQYTVPVDVVGVNLKNLKHDHQYIATDGGSALTRKRVLDDDAPQTKKKLKTAPHHINTTINDLPAEVMRKIFKYCPTETLVFVCKHWKILVEQLYDFEMCKFYDRQRTEMEKEILAKSGRRCKGFVFKFFSQDEEEFEVFKEHFKKNPWTSKVHLIFNFNWVILVEFVYEVLEVVKNLSWIKITIESQLERSALRMEEFPKEFPNLKTLDIAVHRYTDMFHLEALTRATPKLETFKLRCDIKQIADVSIYFWKVFYDYQATLKSVTLIDVDDSQQSRISFHWDPDSLCVDASFQPIQHGMIERLLRDKLTELQTVSFCCVNGFLLHLVLERAKGIKSMELRGPSFKSVLSHGHWRMGISIPLDAKFCLPSVESLKMPEIGISVLYALNYLSMFPNVTNCFVPKSGVWGVVLLGLKKSHKVRYYDDDEGVFTDMIMKKSLI